MKTFSDVSIVGAGFFGVSAALLLARQGYSVTLFVGKNSLLSSLPYSLGVLWPALNDPPTRAHVAHGEEVAFYLNNFCSLGIDLFQKEFPALVSSHWKTAPSFRLGLQNFEQEELEKAMALGFPLSKTAENGVFREGSSCLVCVSPDELQKVVLSELQKASVTLIEEEVVTLEEGNLACQLTTANKKVQSEIAILANGFQISKLLPKYESILVPMSDILFEFEGMASQEISPVCFRASNGHVAASCVSQGKKVVLKISGPRFLLPQAGVGVVLNSTHLSEKLLSQIRKFHLPYFEFIAKQYGFSSAKEWMVAFQLKEKNASIAVDCHPCDELPLIGEFGKLGRVLGFAGFLGTGFSAGIAASKIIQELISLQKSTYLHSRLEPRRFQKILHF